MVVGIANSGAQAHGSARTLTRSTPLGGAYGAREVLDRVAPGVSFICLRESVLQELLEQGLRGIQVYRSAARKWNHFARRCFRQGWHLGC